MLNGVLAALRNGERTIVLVTHNLAEGLELADRVAIQARGRFVFEGARSELEGAEFGRLYAQVVEEAARR